MEQVVQFEYIEILENKWWHPYLLLILTCYMWGKNDVANLSHSVYYYSIYVFSINLDGYTYTLVVVYNISKEIEWQFHFYYIWKC
jgi:hypothetical protein